MPLSDRNFNIRPMLCQRRMELPETEQIDSITGEFNGGWGAVDGAKEIFGA